MRPVVLLPVLGVVRGAILLVGHGVARSDRFASDDALGTGLVYLATVLLFSLVVSLADAWRRGWAPSVLTWVVAALVLALGVPAVDALTGRGAQDAAGSVLFLGLLVLVPALVGSGAGGLVHRARARARARRTTEQG